MISTVLRKNLRPANSSDVQEIEHLLNKYGQEGLDLVRTGADIKKNLKDFIVYVDHDNVGKPQQLWGCVALRDYSSGLMEIRSLAVQPDVVGKGIGTLLIKSAIALAVKRQATRIFALTLRPNLFFRLGFIAVDKSIFPQKVWNDCRFCAKLNCCDETALLLDKSH